MNAPRCSDETYVQFLIASQGRVSCSEAGRVQPRSFFAPAHDSFNRLLNGSSPTPMLFGLRRNRPSSDPAGS